MGLALISSETADESDLPLNHYIFGGNHVNKEDKNLRYYPE